VTRQLAKLAGAALALADAARVSRKRHPDPAVERAIRRLVLLTETIDTGDGDSDGRDAPGGDGTT
jgi:hypothetical protein